MREKRKNESAQERARRNEKDRARKRLVRSNYSQEERENKNKKQLQQARCMRKNYSPEQRKKKDSKMQSSNKGIVSASIKTVSNHIG